MIFKYWEIIDIIMLFKILHTSINIKLHYIAIIQYCIFLFYALVLKYSNITFIHKNSVLK